MTAAVLGLAGEEVEIQKAEAVSKSWPGFFEDLGSAGGRTRPVK